MDIHTRGSQGRPVEARAAGVPRRAGTGVGWTWEPPRPANRTGPGSPPRSWSPPCSPQWWLRGGGGRDGVGAAGPIRAGRFERAGDAATVLLTTAGQAVPASRPPDPGDHHPLVLPRGVRPASVQLAIAGKEIRSDPAQPLSVPLPGAGAEVQRHRG